MRNFTNKIWNASRFVMSNLDKFKEIEGLKPQGLWDEKIKELQKTLIEKTTVDLKNFRFNLAIKRLHNSFWHEFCDILLEESKSRLLEGDEQNSRTQNFLLSFLQTYLLLLHPFMPFITEEIWQRLKEKGRLTKSLADSPSIMVADWPKVF